MYDEKKKIPDPLIFGNAGSFFKNPVISTTALQYLLAKYPDMPFYFYKNNLVKLSARWFIDHCDLQGCRFGNAAVYSKQSLILININQKATSDEIIKLAAHIHNKVAKRFCVFLEPEVQFISNFGKVNGLELLSIKDF